MKQTLANPTVGNIMAFAETAEGKRATARTVSSIDVQVMLNVIMKHAPNALTLECDYSTRMRGGWQYVASDIKMKRVSDETIEVEVTRGTSGGRAYKWYVPEFNPAVVSVEYAYRNSTGIHNLNSITFKLFN